MLAFLLYFPCSLTLENASSRTGLRFSFHVVPSQSGLLSKISNVSAKSTIERYVSFQCSNVRDLDLGLLWYTLLMHTGKSLLTKATDFRWTFSPARPGWVAWSHRGACQSPGSATCRSVAVPVPSSRWHFHFPPVPVHLSWFRRHSFWKHQHFNKGEGVPPNLILGAQTRNCNNDDLLGWLFLYCGGNLNSEHATLLKSSKSNAETAPDNTCLCVYLGKVDQ